MCVGVKRGWIKGDDACRKLSMKSLQPRHGSVESEKPKLLSHRPQSNTEVSLLSAALAPSPRDYNWWPGRSRGESIRRDELDLEKWHWVLHLYCSWQIGRVRLQVFPSQSIQTDKKTKKNKTSRRGRASVYNHRGQRGTGTQTHLTKRSHFFRG